MEKTRKIKVLSLVALIVAVLGLTVAFAALSTQLTINGTATFDSASWDIHFENLNSYAEAYAEINGDPILSGTSITGIDVTLTRPEDMVSFDFNIVNKGTINAKIEEVEISKLCTLSSPVSACDWDNDGEVTQSDIDKVNNNISFAMAYGDDASTLKVGDILNAGETKNVGVIIGYIKITEIDGGYGSEDSLVEATEAPKRNLVFEDLSVTIKYVQAD